MLGTESYVLQGLAAAGTFLAGFFAVLRYMIGQIKEMSREHTVSMERLVESSHKVQENNSLVIQSLDKTLNTGLLAIPTRQDMAVLQEHFDTRHAELRELLSGREKIN